MNDTVEYCDLLEIYHVPVLYRGIYYEDIVKELAYDIVKKGGEGIVVRISDSFYYEDFYYNIAKFVRKNHVQTDKHWSQSQLIQNKLYKN